MLDISKSERFFILAFLIFGLFCTGLSYYRKAISRQELIRLDVNENRTFVNINTAGVADFERLPGIGTVLAGQIISYRAKTGRFKNVEELMNIKGIGSKKFEALKDLIITGE